MTTYQFGKQLTKGEKAESRLDQHFGNWYQIVHTTREQQRQGIDRIFTGRINRERIAVEYKSDWTAAQTRNAFVETVSVDTENKPGWALTSHADVLVYYVPPIGMAYWIPFESLRPMVSTWQATYPVRQIPNCGYNTHGLLVPLKQFEMICTQIALVRQ